jgi:L-fuconolactonase
MTDRHTPTAMIDTHQHLWMMSERAYDWIVPAYGPLYADFGPEDVAEDVVAAGITGTVLVQAADTYEDTFYMMSVAKRHPNVKGVVAWAPLDRSAEAEAALDLYALSPVVKGVRDRSRCSRPAASRSTS